MGDEREKLLERIQAILSKTTGAGATEAEAQTAMAFAGRLMTQHNITLAEVEGYQGAEEDWLTADVAGPRDAGGWDIPPIQGLLQRYFFVRFVRTNLGRKVIRWRIFGTRENVENAAWVFGFLRDTFRRLWREHRRRTGAPATSARSYYAGLRAGLDHKLAAERARFETPSDGRALALVESKVDRQFKVAFQLKKMYEPKVTLDARSYEAGQRAGQQINIARPVEGASPLPLAGS